MMTYPQWRNREAIKDGIMLAIAAVAFLIALINLTSCGGKKDTVDAAVDAGADSAAEIAAETQAEAGDQVGDVE